MRVRFSFWAWALGLCCCANVGNGQQLAAPRGSYYAQVARQAVAGASQNMPAPPGFSAPQPQPAAATGGIPMAAAVAGYPPTNPVTAAPLRNPYAPQAQSLPTSMPPAPAAASASSPTATKSYRTLSPLNGIQQVNWQQPRSFTQGRNMPVAPAGYPPPAGGYGAAMLTAANQPTLAPPLPNAGSFTGPGAAYPGMPQAPGAPEAYSAPGIDAGASFAGPNYGTPTFTPPGSAVPTAPGGAPSIWRPPVGGPNVPGASQAFGAPQSFGMPPASGALPPPNFAADPTVAGPAYNGPVYDGMFEQGAVAPGSNWFQPNLGGACTSCGPWFCSLSGLYMTRDVPNNVGLAFANAERAATILNTEQAGFDWHGGFETRFGRTLGTNWALEADYWYLDPTSDAISARSLNNDISSRLDLSNVLFQGFALSNIYENSREQRIYRGNAFQNMELNLWQQALNVDPAGRFGMAFFTGVRYFRYREILEYGAVQANSEFSDNDPNTQSWYHIRMRNNLIGWQLGGRGQLYLGQKLRLFAIPRAGVFGNVISQQQDLCMVINLHSKKTDVALLGQIDLGVAYQLFRCCSVFASYRAMGIAGVANADDQIARDFTSLPDMANINSSGSIILHGLNAGMQFQF